MEPLQCEPQKNVNILVPPQKPKIINERGEMVQTLAGPYDEGSDMILLCEVRGGSPPPKISWLLNGKQLDSTMMDFSFASTQTSKLVIKNLSRMHQHAMIVCRASNFPKTEQTTNVTIDLLRKYTCTYFKRNAIIICVFFSFSFSFGFRVHLNYLYREANSG